MRRLLPLLAAVLALAASSTASADTFRVERPHAGGPGSAALSGGPAISFSQTQNGPMAFAALRVIWQAAGNRYGIPWEVLGAINKVETNFGSNLGPSSAGAVGWMQFMPSTWARWGIDANGDGVADPTIPRTRSSAPRDTSPAAEDSSTSSGLSTATTTPSRT
jgi:membrane-bound lytic murein transglycosylase B